MTDNNMPDNGMRVLGKVPAGDDSGGLPALTLLGKAETAGPGGPVIVPVSRPD
jgi:hypothetical protein